MPELRQLLREYDEVSQQLERLEARKKMLREAISAAMGRQDAAITLAIGDTVVRANVRTSVTVKYDEAGLRQRLGSRFRLILDPDVKKLRAHMQEIRPALEPFLDTVGSVSRELVRQAIERGQLTNSDFAGLYEKQTKKTLIVRRELATPASPDHNLRNP